MTNTVTKIIDWIKEYFIKNGPECKAVIGISGGKDSTVAAALLCKALGPNRVIAVQMPQGFQYDIDVSNEVIDYLEITEHYNINIGSACQEIFLSLPNDIRIQPQVTSNVPARVRMNILYAIAASRHGRVVNTCNRSEDYVGYSTKFGDAAGDFSILSNYTATKVKEIGIELGLPKNFIEKPPEDGLSGLTDEENLGFSYDVLDNFLLNGITPPYEIYKNIEQRHKRNLHKISPMPTCPFFS
jgi:NAD+ synthase